MNTKDLIKKRICKVLLFTIIFILITQLLNFCIVVPNSYSRDAWDAYSKKSQINTLFLGSSVGRVADVNMIDKILGTNSINMSTPDQLYKTQYDALDFITRRNPVNMVVLVLKLDSIKSDENYVADYSFRSAMNSKAPVYVRVFYEIKDKLIRYQDKEFMCSADSINIWFDWVMCPLRSWDNIKKYTNERINNIHSDIDDNNFDLGEELYNRQKETTDEGVMIELDNDLESLSLQNIACFEIDEESLKLFDSILRFLEINDIKAVVMVAPARSDEKEMYGNDYDKLDKYMKYFTEKRNAAYINLDTDAEVRKKLDETKNSFRDREHLTEEGIRAVSPVIADRLRDVQNTDY